MAKIVDFTRVYLEGNSSYILADEMSLTNSSGDLLLLWVAVDGQRVLTIPSGWTDEINNRSVGVSGYLISKVATTANEALPTITLNTTDEASIVGVSVTGQSTSTPIVDITENRATNVTSTWSAHTTTNDKSLVLYFGAVDLRDIHTPFEVNQFFSEEGAFSDLGLVTATGGWRWEEVAGTIPSCSSFNSLSDGWHCVSVSIKDHAGSSVPPDFFFENWPRLGTASSGITGSWTFIGDVEASGVLVDGSAPVSITFDASTGPISTGSGVVDSGTGTVTGFSEIEERIVTDATKSWTIDQWKGYTATWDGETHYIKSNTATTFTTVNSQRAGIGSKSYTINRHAAVTLDSATTDYVNGRLFVVEANGATLPTGMTDGDYVWITYLDSTTVGITTVTDDVFYRDGGLNNLLNLTAVGSGTATLRELSIVPKGLNTELNVFEETGAGWMGRGEDYTTAIDLTGKTFQYELQVNLGREMYILLVDADGDWITYQVNGRTPVQGITVGQIDVENTTKETYEHNTFDLTRVKKAVLLLKKEVWKDPAYATTPRFSTVSKFEIAGGQASDKITWQKLQTHLGNYFPGTTASSSSGQFAYFNTIEMGGSGTFDTHFEDVSKSVAFPPESDGVEEFRQYTPSVYVKWKGTGSSGLVASNHQWYGGAPYSFTIDAGDLSGAEIGGVFINATFSANALDTYDGDSFNGGNGVTPNGADFTNCVFDDVPTLTQGTSDFTRSTIRNSPSAVAYVWGTGNNDNITVLGTADFDTAGTYTLVGATVTEVTNSSGGSVILNVDSNTTITTNTGPDISIVQNVDITAPNLINGTRVQIYNITKAIELDNSLVSGGSGYSYTENLLDASLDVGDTIRLRAAYQSGTNAKNELEVLGIMTASGLSFVDAQTDNSIYNDYGVNGSLITEFAWDGANLEVDVNDSDNVTQIQRVGAWYSYYITTATGISELFGAVSWESLNSVKIITANVNLELDNLKTAPLLLGGGRLYRDDGATIINSSSNSIQVDYSPVYTTDLEASLNIINQGVQNASISVPHTLDL